MRHKVSGLKLNRTSAHRKALLKNLANALIEHERIRTTLPKARALRPVVEKLVTLSRKGTLHARRQLISRLQDRRIVSKLLDELSIRYKNRPGGYLRIVKAGYRYGDSAPMGIIEFVDRPTTSSEQSSGSSEN